MHISLDQAIGRQPRLNRVGQSLLNIGSGASAAYSLRSLTGGDPKVVNVRRSSDNEEEEFTASEITSGALEAFVGAGNDGFVVTWYDQSGNGDDVEQNTLSRQAKIADSSSGLLVDANGNAYLKFDGTDDFYSANKTTFNNVSYGYVSAVAQYSDITAANETIYFSSKGDTGTSARVILGKISSAGAKFSASGRRLDSDTFKSSQTAVDLNKNLFTGLYQWADGDVQLVLNGAEQTAVAYSSGAGNTSATDANSAFIGRISSSYYDGNLYELIIYNTDQSGNRSAIETNTSEHYDITLS